MPPRQVATSTWRACSSLRAFTAAMRLSSRETIDGAAFGTVRGQAVIAASLQKHVVPQGVIVVGVHRDGGAAPGAHHLHRTITLCNAEIHKQIQQLDVFHSEKLPHRRYPKDTVQVSFTASDCTQIRCCSIGRRSCKILIAAVLPASDFCLADISHFQSEQRNRRKWLDV